MVHSDLTGLPLPLAFDLDLALAFGTRSGLDGASDGADVDFMVLGPRQNTGRDQLSN